VADFVHFAKLRYGPRLKAVKWDALAAFAVPVLLLSRSSLASLARAWLLASEPSSMVEALQSAVIELLFCARACVLFGQLR